MSLVEGDHFEKRPLRKLVFFDHFRKKFRFLYNCFRNIDQLKKRLFVNRSLRKIGHFGKFKALSEKNLLYQKLYSRFARESEFEDFFSDFHKLPYSILNPEFPGSIFLPLFDIL